MSTGKFAIAQFYLSYIASLNSVIFFVIAEAISAFISCDSGIPSSLTSWSLIITYNGYSSNSKAVKLWKLLKF